MFTTQKIMCLTAILLMQSGCGFYLRGTEDSTQAHAIGGAQQQSVYVNDLAASAELHQIITDALMLHKITPLPAVLLPKDASAQADACLVTIEEEKLSERMQTLTGRGQLREIKLQYQVRFSVQKSGKTLNKTLSTSRDLSVNEVLILSKTQEKAYLLKDMQTELAGIAARQIYQATQNITQ